MSHRNARVTPHGRRILVQRVRVEGMPVAHVAKTNRTLQIEWAYRQVFTSNDKRTRALAPWLDEYNTQRRHSALGGQPPISRLSPT